MLSIFVVRNSSTKKTKMLLISTDLLVLRCPPPWFVPNIYLSHCKLAVWSFAIILLLAWPSRKIFHLSLFFSHPWVPALPEKPFEKEKKTSEGGREIRQGENTQPHAHPSKNTEDYWCAKGSKILMPSWLINTFTMQTRFTKCSACHCRNLITTCKIYVCFWMFSGVGVGKGTGWWDASSKDIQLIQQSWRVL